MSHTKKAHGTRPLWLLMTLCALLFALPLVIAACSPQSAPASMQAQVEPTSTTSTDAQPTTTATAIIGTPIMTATVSGEEPVSATEVTTGTTVPTETPGTPTPRPTPTGPPPADPYANLTIFGFVTAGNLVAKSDKLPLDGAAVDNVLLTITESRLGVTHPLTEEVTSALGVGSWDPVYREWNLAWQSVPISGVARLIPSANQPGGWNGNTLLGTSDRVLALRTTTLDGAAHLQLFKWNKDTHAGEPLRMVPAGGGPEQDAVFDADLDVNMADLDEDGKWEVIADNVAGVQTWRWDGSKYIPVETP